MYIRSGWNKIDISNISLIVFSMFLRLTCADVDTPTPAEVTWSADGVLNASRWSLAPGPNAPLASDAERCVHLEAWARNAYGLVLSLLFLKLLSYGTYFENIGVYIIILGEVPTRDVSSPRRVTLVTPITSVTLVAPATRGTLAAPVMRVTLVTLVTLVALVTLVTAGGHPRRLRVRGPHAHDLGRCRHHFPADARALQPAHHRGPLLLPPHLHPDLVARRFLQRSAPTVTARVIRGTVEGQ